MFIKKAYKSSLGVVIDDETISLVVQDAVSNSSVGQIQQQLKDAVLFLDETSVLTIHSFCQQTLTEFAFETNQLFGAETMQDPGSIISDEVNKFWRKHITTIPAGLLRHLIDNGITRESIVKVVQEHLNGKKYFYYEAGKKYGLCLQDQELLIAELDELKQKQVEFEKEIIEYIQNNHEQLRRISEANTHARRARLHTFQPQELLDYIKRKRGSAYIVTLYSEILTRCDDCDKVLNELKRKVVEIINDTNCQAINAVTNGLDDYKLRNNLMSFEDMIVNLHKALTNQANPRLINALQKKYKAVFVDEFQDTDRLQYEIFSKAFGNNTILFLIGDPKQSIYAWRKADIFTYFKARSDVKHRYTMNTNFRSSAYMIEAMNRFFLPVENFDTFYFNNSSDSIIYRKVDSRVEKSKGGLYLDSKTVTPLSITVVNNSEEILATVTSQVIDIVSNSGYIIEINGRQETIRPSDIGILVRSKRQAVSVKKELAKHGIPAVTIDDTRVLQSDEAKNLLYLLEAMINITRSQINRALLSPFTGYNPADILKLNDEVTLALFRKYRAHWQTDGVYTALMHFVADFNVRAVLLNPAVSSGERIIANLFQLIELVHKVQTNKQFSPAELVSWLRRGIEGMEIAGDEYEQRVETDEDSVKIVTIHRSKGLEYKIVIAPFLDFVLKDNDFYSFREPLTGEYVSIDKSRITDEQRLLVTIQNEQENRRLLYVAITRAIYKCYVVHNRSAGDSTLAQFLQVLKDPDETCIKYEMAPAVYEGFRYRQRREYSTIIRKTPVNFELKHSNWSKMSYTMLAQKPEGISRPRSAFHPDKYDHFMFSQLTRGNKTGNLLHYIFENINFADTRNWKQVIQEALKQWLPVHSELHMPMLLEMLHQTLNIPILVGANEFRLSEISYEKRIHEFGFDFPVPEYNPYELNKLSDDDIDIRVTWDKLLEGIVNGKMDLFFEHQEKYYILDWKSNFLGDQVTDYAPIALAAAMNENNYHLQYLLYTLAAKKYLTVRLRNFDYEKHFGGVIYLFVRGVRMDGRNGLYTNRPTLQQLTLLEQIMGI
jgi:exodeoxyribonuclease V beta subunit